MDESVLALFFARAPHLALRTSCNTGRAVSSAIGQHELLFQVKNSFSKPYVQPGLVVMHGEPVPPEFRLCNGHWYQLVLRPDIPETLVLLGFRAADEEPVVCLRQESAKLRICEFRDTLDKVAQAVLRWAKARPSEVLDQPLQAVLHTGGCVARSTVHGLQLGHGQVAKTVHLVHDSGERTDMVTVGPYWTGASACPVFAS